MVCLGDRTREVECGGRLIVELVKGFVWEVAMYSMHSGTVRVPAIVCAALKAHAPVVWLMFHLLRRLSKAL